MHRSTRARAHAQSACGCCATRGRWTGRQAFACGGTWVGCSFTHAVKDLDGPGPRSGRSMESRSTAEQPIGTPGRGAARTGTPRHTQIPTTGGGDEVWRGGGGASVRLTACCGHPPLAARPWPGPSGGPQRAPRARRRTAAPRSRARRTCRTRTATARSRPRTGPPPLARAQPPARRMARTPPCSTMASSCAAAVGTRRWAPPARAAAPRAGRHRVRRLATARAGPP